MTDENVFKEKKRVHEKFNASDSDVTIESADGVLFCLHTQNLKINTGAFPGSEFSSKGEPTKLTENSDVLEVLFAYIYPQRHPNLENMEFSLLAKIAEAVEKYEVFPAMNLCPLRMREFLSEHADDILVYGTKHDDPQIVNEAALALSRSPLTSKFIFKFSPTTSLAWVRYSESWDIIFGSAIEDIDLMKKSDTSECSGSSRAYDRRYVTNECRLSLLKWVRKLEKIPSVGDLNAALTPLGRRGVAEPWYCDSKPQRSSVECSHLKWIAEAIQDRIAKIPPFQQYLDEAKRYLDEVL